MADIADEAADLQAQEIALALSAPKPPSGDNPFPGLVPSPARPDTSD